MEGTIKKCVLRVFGTCSGGMSAWLLILVTGNNTFGSVAWLSISTAIAVFVSVEKNGSARLGQSRDFGYGGFYFVLTQSVVVLEYEAGIGDRDELVANRVASNLIGIMMATFLAFIPPHVRGNSPRYAQLLLDEISKALDTIKDLLVSDASKEEYDTFEGLYTNRTSALYSDALYLVNDAERLSACPCFSVDPELKASLSDIAISSSFVKLLLHRLSAVAAANTWTNHEKLTLVEILGSVADKSSDELFPTNIRTEEWLHCALQLLKIRIGKHQEMLDAMVARCRFDQ
jgi:Fusaric acid resistance protein-like